MRSRPRPPRSVRRSDQPLEYNILITATLCLLAVGAVMVYSASSVRTLLEGAGNGTELLVKYVAYGTVGLGVMFVLARHGVGLVERLTRPLLVVSFACLVAVKIPGLGVEVNGATRWLGAGPLQFQPSELAKLALVLYAASLLAARPQRLQTLWGLISPLLLVAGACALLVVSQPDLGTALVICLCILAMLMAAGAHLRHLGVLCVLGAGAVMLFAVSADYRRERLMTFLDPWAQAGDAGFQIVQGQIAVGSGGMFGLGPGQSVQKVFYLPEAHTDFILAVIGEELGVVGICGLLFLYGQIAYAGLRAAKAARTVRTQLLAAGVTSLILCQALLNVFAVLGMVPLTGVPLPFISSGSSSLLTLLAGVGLLANIASAPHTRLRAVPTAKSGGSGRGHDAGPDRRRRHGGARGARAGGGRRAAG
ncbi:MAG TPA: putative lipid II flippase FtsW [Solirubrobacteraceae bacterium]|nr:putative lipid II flippase FtsW [Solirubrobacteraceae bacterium]